MRRANGTGNIIKLSGNRRLPFAIRISYYDRHQHIQRRYLSFHRTCAEAQNALDKYNASLVAGAAPAPDKLSTTLEQVYTAWSARKFAKAGTASVSSYKASWNRLSILGNIKMRDITTDHLQRIIDQDEDNGCSKSTINNDHILMRALFKYAMERDIVMKDYSEFVQLPHVDIKHEKGAFTDFQLKKIEQMASTGVPWADTVLMLCYTGFRITEFLTLTRFSYHTDGEYLQGGLKTDAGKNRVVPIHPKIKPYLLQWLSKNGDTIICQPNGKPITATWYREHAFAPIMKELDTPQATPHWCRHTFSSKLHAAGVPELEQKRLLGHSNKDITDHYTHIDIRQLSAAVLKLA